MNHDPRFPQVLQQLEGLRSTEILPSLETYEYRSDLGWKPLQRLAIWVLRKIGAHALLKAEIITYRNLQAEELHNMILLGIKAVPVAEYREAKTLFIGADEWRELTQNPAVAHEMQYLAGPFRHSRDRKLYGLRVKVCPWIKGWAVV